MRLYIHFWGHNPPSIDKYPQEIKEWDISWIKKWVQPGPHRISYEYLMLVYESHEKEQAEHISKVTRLAARSAGWWNEGGALRLHRKR